MRIKIREFESESYFDRQRMITGWDQSAIFNAKVFVAGAGAIGNEVLKNLVLLGFRRFFICDFDTVETSNLSRTVLFGPTDLGAKKAEVAAARLCDMVLDNDAEVEWFHGDVVWNVGLGAFAECDVVLSCLDNIEARRAIGRACKRLRIPFVDAGIAGLAGHVAVYPPEAEACYLCNLSTAQSAAARRRYSCDDVKRRMIAEEKVATVQISSAIVAGIQSQEVVKFVMDQQVDSAFRISYDGVRLELDVFKLLASSYCAESFHDKLEYSTCEVSSRTSVGDALAYFRRKLGPEAVIDLSGDREIVRSVNCRRCGRPRDLLKPSFELYDDELYCVGNPHCVNNLGLPKDVPTPKTTITLIDDTQSLLLDKTLAEVGVPPKHIITVTANGVHHSFLLYA